MSHLVGTQDGNHAYCKLPAARENDGQNGYEIHRVIFTNRQETTCYPDTDQGQDEHHQVGFRIAWLRLWISLDQNDCLSSFFHPKQGSHLVRLECRRQLVIGNF